MSVLTPSQSQTDLLDGVNGYPVPISQTTIRFRALPDFYSGAPIQFRAAPTADVRGTSNGFKMMGRDTASNAAQVIQLHPGWNWADELVVRDYMGNGGSVAAANLPVFRTRWITTDPDPARSVVTAILNEVIALGDRLALATTAAKSYFYQRVTSLVEVARKGLAERRSAGPSFYLDATQRR